MKQKQKNDSEKPLVIVTTGGSGGHIFPAEAIAEALLKKGMRVAFITDRRGQAFQKLKDIPVYRLMAESVTGKSIFGKILAGIKLYLGVFQAGLLIIKLKPSVIIGVGGYASIPAVFAGDFLSKASIVLHEQNAVLGRANRMLSRITRRIKMIATSFCPTLQIPGEVTQIQVGLPVRSTILDCQNTPYPKLKSTFHLLVFGGSQGARFFTTKLPEALLALPKDIRSKIELVQQVRPEDMETAHNFYDTAGFKKVILKSFFTDMPEQLQKAHLVIGRGGAGTLTELMIVGRPGIIIPLPTAADNHQMENARIFCDKGGGWLVNEKDFNSRILATRLEKLITSPELLQEAARHAFLQAPKNAAEKMADVVWDIVQGDK